MTKAAPSDDEVWWPSARLLAAGAEPHLALDVSHAPSTASWLAVPGALTVVNHLVQRRLVFRGAK